MEEIAYMVCVRADSLEDPVEGSTTTACVECGSDIWISVESRKEMGRVGAMPICAPCAARIAEEMPTEVREFGTPSDGQFEEILQGLRNSPHFTPEWQAVLDGTDDLDTFESMKVTARMAGEAFDDPNDDWGVMAIMENYEGVAFPAIPLSQMMGMGIPKQVIARNLLPGLVQASQAKAVYFGLSTWTLEGEGLADFDGPVHDHPDRKEKLVLLEVTADGMQRISFADIKRDGISKPELGEWFDVEKPDGSDGLFVDALVPTLRLVRELRELPSE